MEKKREKEINLIKILRKRILIDKAFNAALCCIFFLFRVLLFLRYRIKMEGLEEFKWESLDPNKGILFLPNHPAEIDPIMLMMTLWKKFRLRPLVIEHFFYIWGTRFCLKFVHALSVPSLAGTSNKWKLKQVDRLIAHLEGGLKEKHNFLIYPAGRLKETGEEIIGGASLLHNLFLQCSDPNVVLIRISGLWGSRFSRALSGKVPSLRKAFWDGFKIILKNGIFFVPRRLVTIEFSPAPADFPYKASRHELNKYLEKWYNSAFEGGVEQLKLVTSCFWKEEFPEVKEGDRIAKFAFSELAIPEEIEKNICLHLASVAHCSVEEIKRDMHLSFDLGLDSLDVANLYCFLDEQYEVNNLPHGELRTVDDLLKAALGYKLRKEESADIKATSSNWVHEKFRKSPRAPMGESVPEAFLYMCNRMERNIACTDLLSGTLTYSDLKLQVITLALKIKDLPGKNIGVLLPASVSVNVVILACMLANKVPVMLNWKSGFQSLLESVKLTGIEIVISSYRFLGKLENGDLEPVENLFLFTEDLSFHISFKKKMTAWLLSKASFEILFTKFHLEDIEEHDLAAILFTSGTESVPKAVPLTHGNLLSNQRAAFTSVPLKKDDIFYSVLPPFHSFGFSVTGLMGLLCGVKTCYAPDPTDTYGLVEDISKWRPTVFCCLPSLLQSLLRVGDSNQLKSIRLFVSGADKAPVGLVEKVAQLGTGARLIEGYGITECGPIVALMRPDFPHQKGVGQPLPGVEMCVIDVETHQPLPVEQEGEICIRSPGVFKGYLSSHPSPFIFIKEKNWYKSGDKGFLDQEGNVFLSGRLKRFVKIGGESVCLTGLEEDLTQIAANKKWSQSTNGLPPLALTVKINNPEKPQIILFTTFDISKEEVNSVLKENGFRRIIKIAEVKRLEQIPLTGTGKTHYRLLDDMN